MDVIELTQKLVGFETINPPGFEADICRYLEALFIERGFETSVSNFGEGRCNLVARLGGASDKPPLGITGHMDTVPLGLGEWQFDPFSGAIADGRIYGRGTCDMKGGVAAAICAAFDKVEQLKNGPGITFIITGGEETGSQGALHCTRHNGLRPPIGALIVAEPTNMVPLSGHKGVLWIKAICKGKSAHGSMPENGENAIWKMAHMVHKLRDFSFDNCAHPYLGKPSLNIGTIKGGQNTNSVADHAEITIDIRTLPDQDHMDLLNQLQHYLGADIALEPFVDLPGVWTQTDDTWFARLEGLVADTTGQKHGIQTAPYFTDASVLTPHFDHVPTVILGPGSPENAHTVDEYCEISELHQAVEIYKILIDDWHRPEG